uniref:Uncharacterized protein n=1 Tax=Plectus sambesii TaxID=2011161 RepID=A0A914XNV0_9BILA
MFAFGERSVENFSPPPLVNRVREAPKPRSQCDRQGFVVAPLPSSSLRGDTQGLAPVDRLTKLQHARALQLQSRYHSIDEPSLAAWIKLIRLVVQKRPVHKWMWRSNDCRKKVEIDYVICSQDFTVVNDVCTIDASIIKQPRTQKWRAEA